MNSSDKKHFLAHLTHHFNSDVRVRAGREDGHCTILGVFSTCAMPEG